MKTTLEIAQYAVSRSLDLLTDAVSTGDTTTLEGDLEYVTVEIADYLEGLVGGVVKGAAAEPLFKVDLEKRMVWGWASVVTEKGAPVIDRQGDVIEVDELQQAVHKFMDTSRVGGLMHRHFDGIGTVVESLVFTNELQKAMGIDLGREGWFVGVRVDHDPTWAAVKSGKLRSFSLGGSGVREPRG